MAVSHHALAHALEAAIAAAREAGAMLRAEFQRPGGARGSGGHAPIDTDAERSIRALLHAHAPSWGFVGEETGEHRPVPSAPYWLVDPNDGTRAYLEGQRGSAVSIALIDGARPVLGVVFAFAAPDGDGDLVAWAKGSPLTRNGAAVTRASLPATLSSEVVVLLNDEHERHARGSAMYVAPARFRCVPSIAYRLALVAVGEADATVSTGGPTDWDVAAGHALLLAAGGDLVDSRGEPLDYRGVVGGSVYGGSTGVARQLAARGRARWESAAPSLIGDLALTTPARGRAIDDAATLRRAQGCLLGQLIGDALGAQVEFEGPSSIRARYPAGVRDLRDGGTWDTLAGQPTDDSELALILARSLVREGAHDPARLLAAYRAWLASRPFDVGGTTAAALHGTPRRESLANGSLMRVAPLAIWVRDQTDDAVATLARSESEITHPNPACGDACAAYCVAVAHALRGEDAGASYVAARAWAERAGVAKSVLDAIRSASRAPPSDMTTDAGLVTKALQNALFRALHAPDVETGLVATVGMGGDTDTNAAIAGALLGALHGREGFPARWRRAVLSCHPIEGTPGVRHPRPPTVWPVDALVLAEALVARAPVVAPAVSRATGRSARSDR